MHFIFTIIFKPLQYLELVKKLHLSASYVQSKHEYKKGSVYKSHNIKVCLNIESQSLHLKITIKQVDYPNKCNKVQDSGSLTKAESNKHPFWFSTHKHHKIDWNFHLMWKVNLITKKSTNVVKMCKINQSCNFETSFK